MTLSDVKLNFFSKSKLESKKSIKTRNLFLIVLDYMHGRGHVPTTINIEILAAW